MQKKTNIGCQITERKLNIDNEYQMLTNFAKNFLIDLWLDSECASGLICRAFV